jgi:hypothetical protein
MVQEMNRATTPHRQENSGASRRLECTGLRHVASRLAMTRGRLSPLTRSPNGFPSPPAGELYQGERARERGASHAARSDADFLAVKRG